MAETSTANKRLDRRRVVPEGRFRQPRLYLVGEAPGAEEAEQGRPFVGPSGCALRELLEQAGIDLRQLRLTNAIPFRPIEHTRKLKLRNRAPTIEEINHYGAAVLTDIHRSKPRVIVALGSTAARLFGASPSIRASRKAKLQFDGRPLQITFHPAYVRRFGGSHGEPWRKMVADLRRAWKASAMSSNGARSRQRSRAQRRGQ
ncbi:uracil-DNA glycosylase [Bradyrhizobium sp. WSM 1738]|uniref:uracil-DNA glycosylase n=1 Tax=Bradyrhizobium hereditatis TaxID=2821405 RepID=UPI001CE31FDE|nr:uracil-DNA glycosylase [Bradyrhizobium hereditatis]